jgi:CubicO group peptidase (beta-lactamase class C family)
MKNLTLATSIFICAFQIIHAQENELYFPGYGDDWERHAPEEAGMDARLLDDAVRFAKESESPIPVDLELYIAETFAGEPYNDIIGPTKERGPATGVILRNGFIVAEWGEPGRVDMTFSVTKSFLSAVAGIAYDRTIIRDVHDPVGKYVQDGGFDSPHNAQITWHQLLNMTSEWEGTLWGKPDWADRPVGERGEYHKRELKKPGTRWKYNDVRVNRLALSLLRVMREPLPKILRERLMDPIGASRTWEWHGYENSWVKIDGVNVQSISGGGHWGGGMFINAYDMARFGLLCLRNGNWNGNRILSEEWIRLSSTPTDLQPTYGYMNWFLNTNRELLTAAPESTYFHAGAGDNLIIIIPDYNLVVVVRWLNRTNRNEFVGKVLEAVKDR